MKKCNSMYFLDLDKATEFVKMLNTFSIQDDLFYNDIHIYEEESAIIVEWEQIPHDKSYGGEFKFVDEDEVVALEKPFPDGHYELFFSEEQYKEYFDGWLKEHPEWKQDKSGNWYEDIHPKE